MGRAGRSLQPTCARPAIGCHAGAQVRRESTLQMDSLLLLENLWQEDMAAPMEPRR